MTTALESKEVATSVFSMVPVFKKHKVSFSSDRIFFSKLNCEAKTLNNLEYFRYLIKVLKTFSQVDMKAGTMAIPTSTTSSKDSSFKVSIDVKDLEKVVKSLYF